MWMPILLSLGGSVGRDKSPSSQIPPSCVSLSACNPKPTQDGKGKVHSVRHNWAVSPHHWCTVTANYPKHAIFFKNFKYLFCFSEKQSGSVENLWQRCLWRVLQKTVSNMFLHNTGPVMSVSDVNSGPHTTCSHLWCSRISEKGKQSQGFVFGGEMFYVLMSCFYTLILGCSESNLNCHVQK